MLSLPKTIDDVLDTLDAIIQETIDNGNYLGIFAYVYHRTTAQIKQAILDKKFDDNEGMERFDVLFANYYIQAYWDFKAGKKASKAWELSFKAKDDKLIIMQHLIMGMNAHINLDLGVAAAELTKDSDIQAIKADFMKVNDILKELTNEMQSKITKVSPLMFLLDWIGKDKDEVVAGFSIVKARDFAWSVAESIHKLQSVEDKQKRIIEVDNWVTTIGKIVHRPPGKILKWLMKSIRMFEVKEVKGIIEKLESKVA